MTTTPAAELPRHDGRTVGDVRAGRHRVEDAAGIVDWTDGRPGPALRGRALAYTGYGEDTPGPVHRQETPTGHLTLIISFGDELHVQAAPGADELSTYTSFVAGMHDRPSRTAHDGHQLGMQVRLDPLGAFSLFGIPLHELGNRVVELSDLLGVDAERWAGRLLETRAWEDRFTLLDRLLADRMAAGPLPSPELAWAWRTMRVRGGAVRVADLAVGAGCSHRHLVARFREQVGMTPKTAARVLRYTRAAQLTGRNLPLARVAELCGYADQSHLTREFVRFAGTTPGASVGAGGMGATV